MERLVVADTDWVQEIQLDVAEFRANVFKVLDEVSIQHKTVIITRHGKPVAKLTHIESAKGEDKDPLIGAMPGSFKERGDITQPACDPDEWEVNR